MYTEFYLRYYLKEAIQEVINKHSWNCCFEDIKNIFLLYKEDNSKIYDWNNFLTACEEFFLNEYHISIGYSSANETNFHYTIYVTRPCEAYKYRLDELVPFSKEEFKTEFDVKFAALKQIIRLVEEKNLKPFKL